MDELLREEVEKGATVTRAQPQKRHSLVAAQLKTIGLRQSRGGSRENFTFDEITPDFWLRVSMSFMSSFPLGFQTAIEDKNKNRTSKACNENNDNYIKYIVKVWITLS